MRLAVVLTCYNRVQKTKECIMSLQNQKTKHNVDIQYYICDDGSTDDTFNSIKELVPEANVFKSEGGLFWSKGMYVAMKAAESEDIELFLMINDDVSFGEDMLENMISSYLQAGKCCGVVGSTISSSDQKTTYGGWIFMNRSNINKKQLLVPNGKLQKCDLVNWNCFLVDREVIQSVGLIDNKYEHGVGDFDYSCRMSRSQIPIYVAFKHVGICDRNPTNNTYQDITMPVSKRLKHLFSMKGLPVKSYFRFYYKNFGLFGIPFCLWVYLKCISHILTKSDC